MEKILRIALVAIMAITVCSCGSAKKAKASDQERVRVEIEENGKSIADLMASDNLSRMQIHYLHTHALDALKVQLPDDAKRYYKMARELYKCLYFKDDETTDFMNQWQREFRSMKLI